MQYDSPLTPAILFRRYKRFLADVMLADGTALTVHTPNTGSMLGCSEPGSRIWIRDSGNRSRKYPWTWEITETADGVLVGVNTALSNRLVREGIESGVIEELSGYETVRGEVCYGSERSRIDLLLEGKGGCCYVEVKNVTAAKDGIAFFPDAPTARGVKHLRELAETVRKGDRAVLLFCVQREDVHAVRPADHIDSEYGRTLRAAAAQGVELVAYRAKVSPREIWLDTSLPVHLGEMT